MSPHADTPPCSPSGAFGAGWRAELTAAAVLLVAAAAWTATQRPPSLFAFVENSLLRAALLGIALALVRGRHPLRQALGAVDRRELAWLAALVAAGLAARFALEPLPLHPYNWLEPLWGRSVPEPEPGWYANGFGVLVRIPLALGLDFETAVFTVNRLAGAALVVGTWALARALFAEGRIALWAGGLVALLPLHVRLSASETMQVLTSLFQVLALAGFAAHARTGAPAPLWLGVSSAAYASLVRPEGALVFAAAPLVWLVRPGAWRFLARPSSLATVAGTGLVVLPMWVHGALPKVSIMHGHFDTGPRRALATATEALASAGSPHHLLLPFAAVGAAWLLVRRGRAVAAPVALLAMLGVLAGIDTNTANRWQLLVPQIPLYALLAAGVSDAVGAGLAALRAPRAAAVLAAVVALGAAAAAARSPVYDLRGDQLEEYRFVAGQQDLLRSLGPALPLVRSRPEMDGAFSTFPVYRLSPQTPVFGRDDLLAGRVPLPAVWYRGLGCYRNRSVSPYEDVCAETLARFKLEPLATRRLEASPFAVEAHTIVRPPPPEPLEVGFYRVVAPR